MAKNYWIGKADDVADVYTGTASGTWATGDDVTATVDKQTVTVTVGALASVTDVMDALVAAINGVSATDSLIGSETRNRGGQEVGQFRDVKASNVAGVITIESTIPGVDFNLAFSKTSTSGVMGAATQTQTATGKNWFSNSDNWSTGALPNTGDTIVFKDSSVSCNRGLNNTVANLNLDRRDSYTGDLGMYDVDSFNSGYSYWQYRQTKLDLPIVVTTGTQDHVIGELSSGFIPLGLTNIDLGIVAGLTQKLTVNNADRLLSTNGSAVVVSGGNGLELIVNKGSVVSGFDDNGSATILSSVTLNYANTVATDAQVRLGPDVSLANNTTIVQNGGDLYLYETASWGTSITYTMNDGTAEVDKGLQTTGSLNSLIVNASAEMAYSGVDITNLTLRGSLDVEKTDALTVTNASFYDGFTLLNTKGVVTWSNGIDFVNCTPKDGTFNVLPNETWTPTTI